MSTLITADLHFSDNPRDSYRFLVVSRIFEMIDKYKVKMLLILGDITEAKDNHSAALVNEIVTHIISLSRKTEVIILRGNHDGLDPAYPFFEFLREFPNISFYAHPTEREVPAFGNCLFLPHSTDYKRDWCGPDLKSERYDCIFAHNTFKGAQGQHRELDGIPLDIFRKDADVIAGDVHVPHRIGPVTYVGSPYLVDFGDDFRPRMILQRDSGRKSIAVPGPQKRLIECDIVDKTARWPTEGINEGDILKIRMKLTLKQYARWAEIKSEFLAWGKKHGYVIHAIQPVTDRRQGTLPSNKVQRSALSDETVLEEYGANRGLDKRLLTRGKKLMETSK